MIYAVNKTTKEHQAVPGGFPVNGYPINVWRFVEADPDGWIEWQGGECPLPKDTFYEVKDVRGDVTPKNMLMNVRWNHKGDGCDIIAYRPILDADTKPEPPAWENGLPPVGCDVEHPTGRGIVMLPPDVNGVTIIQSIEAGSDGEYKRVAASACRPIRSEEDEAVHAMRGQDCEPFEGMLSRHDFCRAIYSAIRDGKIPGVRLDD